MSIAEACTPPHRIVKSTGKVRRHKPVTVYDPRLLTAVRAAFEAACRQLPAVLTRTELARQNLARRVLAHLDRGERDPQRLAYLAAKDVREAERAETRKSAAFGEERYAAS